MQPFHFLGACNLAFLDLEKSGDLLVQFYLSPGFVGVVEKIGWSFLPLPLALCSGLTMIFIRQSRG